MFSTIHEEEFEILSVQNGKSYFVLAIRKYDVLLRKKEVNVRKYMTVL